MTQVSNSPRLSKKLNFNSKVGLFQILQRIHRIPMFRRSKVYGDSFFSYFLINNQYLDVIFKDADITIRLEWDDNFSIDIDSKKTEQYIVFQQPISITLFALSKNDCINVHFYYNHGNTVETSQASNYTLAGKEKIKTWIEICMKLKNNKNLKEVKVSGNGFGQIRAKILFDLLYGKIKNIEERCYTNRPDDVYFDPKLRLNELYLCDLKTDISFLTKVKTQTLKFSTLESDFLLRFSKYGRLKQNLYLKKIKLSFEPICHVKRDSQHIIVIPNNWQEKLLSKYQKSIEVLKTVNPDIELEFYAGLYFDSQKDLKSTLKNVNQLITNIKLFIDMAQKCDAKVTNIEINQTTSIIDEWSDLFTEKFAEKLKEQYDDKIKLVEEFSGLPINTIEYLECYKEVEIKIILRLFEFTPLSNYDYSQPNM